MGYPTRPRAAKDDASLRLSVYVMGVQEIELDEVDNDGGNEEESTEADTVEFADADAADSEENQVDSDGIGGDGLIEDVVDENFTFSETHCQSCGKPFEMYVDGQEFFEDEDCCSDDDCALENTGWCINRCEICHQRTDQMDCHGATMNEIMGLDTDGTEN